MDKEGLKVLLARGVSVEQIAREWLVELVEDGQSIAEIAETVGLSKATVRHWLGKHGLKTNHCRGPRVRAGTDEARGADMVDCQMVCSTHGEVDHTLDARGCYRCKKCRVEAVTRRRRTVKATLVAEAGGRCVICGYDHSQAALAFHHVDPTEKRMMVSAQGMGIGIARLMEEARKWVLVCHNCHSELEAGVVSLPVE